MKLLKLALIALGVSALPKLFRAVRLRDMPRAHEPSAEGGVIREGSDVGDLGDVGDVAVSSGLSEVDPEGITQFGEAVDPLATEAAHAEVADLRARLPRPGKNLP